MADDRHTPIPEVRLATATDVAAVAEKAARAYGIGKKAIEATDDLKEWRAELCGKSGKNGQVGRMRKDVDDVDGRLTKVEIALAAAGARAGLVTGILGGIAALVGAYLLKKAGG